MKAVAAYERCKRESNRHFGAYWSERVPFGDGELVVDSTGYVGFVAPTRDGYRGASTDAELDAVYDATVAIAAARRDAAKRIREGAK